MTISSTTVKNSYSGDSSTTTFTYTFKIFADSDIQVIIRSSTGTETTKTITTHYTVTGAGVSAGGTVIFTGGNIPVTGETVILRRNIPQTQAIDYIANDPFPAESHEEGLDRATMAIQQLQEEVTRAIKLSKTNTMTSTEFTVAAADRANKILAFDTNGEISVTQELGTFRGNWATATSYNGRDLVKDTSTNNIFIVDTAHTSSGSQPLTTNANSAFYELIVDAATASSSATAAAASAAAAAASASAASSSASGASTSATNAGISAAASAASASTATAQAALATTSAANAATSETNAGTSASAASTSASNASSSASAASSSASTATTQATNASNSATTATTQASAASASASTATTQATNASNSATTATTQASNASTSATAAAASAASAATLLDNFDDVYLGSKIADPSLDNDNDPLTAGDLYYNSVGNVLKYYTGSAWVAITSGGITDLVQDTSPQLGAALDVNTFSITSTSNGNITLQPNGTGDVVLSADTVKIGDANTDAILTTDGTGDITISTNSGSNSGTVKIFDGVNANIEITPNGSGVVKLDGLSYPTADGTANQVLQTNGSGVLSFATLTADGTADWDTTVKTTGFTATANKGYFCNTTSAAFTVTLPSSPSAGDEIIIVDYAGTFATNNLIITSTPKINSSNNDVKLTTNREATRLVYIDSTQGYIAYSGVNEGTSPSLTDNPPTYSVDFLVVAGGGGGTGSNAGGGGAGGFRTSTQSVAGGTVITVTVGDGGAAATYPTNGISGSSSSISGSGLTTITSAGGGGGNHSGQGLSGGSGGGNSYNQGSPGGLGNTPSTSPSQGNNGGFQNSTSPFYGAAGGGGAGAAGGGGNSTTGGNGGNGSASSITGSSVTYAGGGGGAVESTGTIGTGGTGGGGAGGNAGTAATAGTVNTGGGGGSRFSGPSQVGGAGGKGIVILSIPTASYSGTITGSPTESTSGSNKILQFTGSGSYTA